MNTKAFFGLVLVLASMVVSSAFADGGSHPESAADYTVTLQSGHEITVVQPEAQLVCSNILELLKTANVNSSEPKTRDWPDFQVPGVQKDYRWTVGRRYFLVSFKQAQTIKTMGGSVAVREVVIGLNSNTGRNQLFTIGDDGRVVSYALYSGPVWLELMKAAKNIAGDDA